jgi:hypothetical protein
MFLQGNGSAGWIEFAAGALWRPLHVVRFGVPTTV